MIAVVAHHQLWQFPIMAILATLLRLSPQSFHLAASFGHDLR